MSSGRVVSRDGASIAYYRVGRGPAVVLVDGALCSRAMGPMAKIATELAGSFTVFTYDRRGRGESTDAAPYAVAREVEDLRALLAEAGGSACALGISSGALLALTAAADGAPLTKLALYEAPIVVPMAGERAPLGMEARWAEIDAAVAAGRRGDAVSAFLRAVGVPGPVRAIMRVTPVWSRLTAVAHTLPYDGALAREVQRGQPLPEGRWAQVNVPALVLHGGRSPAWMQAGTRALAAALPRGEYRVLDGQTHDVRAKAIAPALKAFFA
jgi:pimeloyl-ACP methyl ester carboxylesterase